MCPPGRSGGTFASRSRRKWSLFLASAAAKPAGTAERSRWEDQQLKWHNGIVRDRTRAKKEREAQQLAQYKGRTSAKGNYSGISETAWKNARGQEVGFWDGWLRTKGMSWKTTYTNRLNVSMPFLFQYLLIASSAPAQKHFRALDVGAGPLTCAGFRVDEVPGATLEVFASDPLAPDYDGLLRKHGLTPISRTLYARAEYLTEVFPRDAFDLVFARNSLDHSFDPVKAISEMAAVLKPGGYVVIEGHPNEASHQRYDGFHQWNFFLRGSRLIIQRFAWNEVDVQERLSEQLAEVNCRKLTHHDATPMLPDARDYMRCEFRKRGQPEPRPKPNDADATEWRQGLERAAHAAARGAGRGGGGGGGRGGGRGGRGGRARDKLRSGATRL